MRHQTSYFASTFFAAPRRAFDVDERALDGDLRGFGAVARFLGAALRGFDAGLLAFFGGALRAAPVRDFFDEGLAAPACFTALRGARRALPAAFFVTAFPAGGAGGAGDDPRGEAAAAGFAGEAALRTRTMVFRNNKELPCQR